MKQKRTIALLAATAVLAVFLFGCSKAGVMQQVVWKDGKDLVSIACERDKEGNAVPRGYSHPRELTEQEMDQILSNYLYSDYQFFSWRKPKPVFVEIERQKLRANLSEAFAQAGPDQWIVFSSTAKKRDFLLPTPRLTDGILFFKDNELHMVLINLNWEQVDYEEKRLGDPRSNFTLGSLKLVPGDHQRIPEVDVTDKTFKREHRNWIITDVDALLAPEPEPVPEPVEPAEPAEPTIEERLKELQRLFEQGLITEEEYNRKKEEILQEL